MVIVISDDGTVDLIPNLRPRVAGREVEKAVQNFCDYSGIKGNDGEKWAQLNEQVESFFFYLNEEQCNRVNEAYKKEMDMRMEAGGIKLTRRPLLPNPEMDDSYFLD